MAWIDPMDYTIREITPTDAAEYMRLRLEALTLYPHAFAETVEEHSRKSRADIEAEIAALYASGGFMLGAFDRKNKLCGTVCLNRSMRPRLKHRGHIWGVYVTKRLQRRGIAQKLFETVIDKARKIPGIVQLDIGAVTTNEASFSLYRKLGFKQYGTMHRCLNVNGVYLDEHVMAMDLE